MIRGNEEKTPSTPTYNPNPTQQFHQNKSKLATSLPNPSTASTPSLLAILLNSSSLSKKSKKSSFISSSSIPPGPGATLCKEYIEEPNEMEDEDDIVLAKAINEVFGVKNEAQPMLYEQMLEQEEMCYMTGTPPFV